MHSHPIHETRRYVSISESPRTGTPLTIRVTRLGQNLYRIAELNARNQEIRATITPRGAIVRRLLNGHFVQVPVVPNSVNRRTAKRNRRHN
jgi:hypothetical protein